MEGTNLAFSCLHIYSSHIASDTVQILYDSFCPFFLSLPQQPYFRKGLKLQLRRTTYKNVDGLIFVFNAVEKDRANELEHFVKVWKMLASESPNAKALRDFGMKLKASMVEAQARPHELKLLATSVFDRESVFDAWRTVFRSLCGTSKGWSECVSSCFGLGTKHLGGINENQFCFNLFCFTTRYKKF
ncbi:hypothetical protein CAEBREN_07112 [Caenorhabditis brenneri]|uniref:Uncharacterized protein n=1 Tax=Caenorhabditis brenneri TaxID=135651 RepID=G0NIQ9_CAEBE|nr:hypothetical protein CAEBREN_07112 [Caenorhabditis brenneri]